MSPTPPARFTVEASNLDKKGRCRARARARAPRISLRHRSVRGADHVPERSRRLRPDACHSGPIAIHPRAPRRTRYVWQVWYGPSLDDCAAPPGLSTHSPASLPTNTAGRWQRCVHLYPSSSGVVYPDPFLKIVQEDGKGNQFQVYKSEVNKVTLAPKWKVCPRAKGTLAGSFSLVVPLPRTASDEGDSCASCVCVCGADAHRARRDALAALFDDHRPAVRRRLGPQAGV